MCFPSWHRPLKSPSDVCSSMACFACFSWGHVFFDSFKPDNPNGERHWANGLSLTYVEARRDWLSVPSGPSLACLRMSVEVGCIVLYCILNRWRDQHKPNRCFKIFYFVSKHCSISINPPACRRLIGRCCACFCSWFVLVAVLGLWLFLCSLAARFCFVWIKVTPPSKYYMC
jgi:hypothetical protein